MICTGEMGFEPTTFGLEDRRSVQAELLAPKGISPLHDTPLGDLSLHIHIIKTFVSDTTEYHPDERGVYREFTWS